MSEERSSILGGRQTSTTPASDPDAIYHDSSQSPTMRMLQILFVGTVVIMVLVTIILSIYRGLVLGSSGSTYFMLGINLIGFVVVEICLGKDGIGNGSVTDPFPSELCPTSYILFIRRGDLPKGKTWFLYFVGMCVILEAIFTDILLFK